MINLTELCKFLAKAKKATYASGDEAQQIKEKDNSTSLYFEEGDWKYHDNYFGGEPYGGREVVFYQNKPVYIMVYYGQVKKDNNFGEVYEVLQNALKQIPENKPYRGPEKYTENNLEYNNSYEGEVDNFYGTEIIKSNNEIVYQAKYIGGLVDQNR